MSEPMLCCRGGGYCARCDLLVGLDGLRVVEVARDAGGALSVTVESEPEGMGCRACGVVAHAHGRVVVDLVGAPSFGRRVRIRWLKRRWVRPDPDCPTATFVEQNAAVASPRATLTVRACWWAIGQLRR
jgi:transposase